MAGAMQGILEVFQQGGVLMYPLLLCSVFALAIIIERFVNLRRSRLIRPDRAEAVSTLVEGGIFQKAEEVCRKNPSPLTNILGTILEHRALPREELKEIVVEEGGHELRSLERYLGVLATIGRVSPLLGLLGTVLGMIDVFSVISRVGVGHAEMLSGGISKALITTATGLSIAIPSIVMHRYFRGRAEAILSEIEKQSFSVLRKMYLGEGGERARKIDAV